MLSLIGSYEQDPKTVEIDGRSFPSPSLVEDSDGLRWMIDADAAESVRSSAWTAASAAGAMGLVTRAPDGRGVWAMSSETFIEERASSTGGRFTVEPKHWRIFDQFPTYAALIARTAAQEKTEPSGAVSDEMLDEIGFVHLHTHSEYSLLDGVSMVSEIVDVTVEQGGKYASVCDHGNCAGHPDLQVECDKAGIKPIFAMEAYLVDDRHKRLEHFTLPEPKPSDFPKDPAGLKAATDAYKERRAEFVAALKDYWHLVLIATDKRGLHNLWAMSTEAFQEGKYGKNPRLDWDTLARHSEGVIATTACLRGPLLHKGLLDGDFDGAMTRLARLQEIFNDRLYLEIHTNQLPQQIQANQMMVELSRQHRLPLVAAVDAHYARPEHKHPHRVWLSIQTDSDINDDSSLFGGDQNYHLADEAEVRASLAYLGQDVVAESIRNTARVALQATAEVRGTPTPPVFSKNGPEEDRQRLLDLCLSNWGKTTGKRFSEAEYVARFEREFNLLSKKSFCGYFLMTADMTNHAKRNGILVGPGRGSGGGSLVAYLAGITDIDPIESELLFERFMTEGRTELPDFDVDYPASKKQFMQQYVRTRYGEKSVTVVGTVSRLKNRGIIDKLGKAMSSVLPEGFYVDALAMKALIADAEADSAGLGMKWADMMERDAERWDPLRKQYPEFFEMADILVGRVHTFGQHAAGMVVTTDGALTDSLPLRTGDESHLIAQFDKDVLERLGYVKFDLLTLDNLDRIQATIDLIRERRGHEVDVYAWREQYEDPQVWEEIAEAHTLGIFQIETNLSTQYARRLKPRSLADLADLVTIVRPGPRNSGLTESYLRRRNGEEPVTYPDPRMEQVLAKSFGSMLYQEDIMQACMLLAGYDSNEADKVRKILGKKKVEQAAIAGQEFIERATQRGMQRENATALWAQMQEFSKYAFNRAHAFAYAVLALWGAWLKFHYPIESLTSSLSGVDMDRVPEFVKEARRMGYKVLPPDINHSGAGFQVGGNALEIRYGLEAISGIGEPAALAIKERAPYTSYDDFLTRVVEDKTMPAVNMGTVRTLAHIGAFDSVVPNRRGLETVLLADKSGESTRCVFKQDTIPIGAPNGLPCVFDWSSEPDPINPKTGKKMKRKAPPKRCTKACRQYTPPPPLQVADVEPYTDRDIREIEASVLGVFLTSQPFDMLPDDERQYSITQAELALDPSGPGGAYLLMGVLVKVRPYTDKSGRKMAFLEFETERGAISVTAFNTEWTRYSPAIRSGALYVVEAFRNPRGFTLQALAACE